MRFLVENLKALLGGLALLTSTCTAGVSAAQSIRVQTGEHANFTRIVLLTDQSVKWRAGRLPEGYGVRFPDGNHSISLEGAFRLIPRDRVQALTWRPDEQMLEIGSNCTCHLNAFEERPGVLVLDVRTGPPPEGHPYETALMEAENESAPSTARRQSAALPIIAATPTLRVPFPSPGKTTPIASLILADTLQSSLRSASQAGLLSAGEERLATQTVPDFAAMSGLIETALDEHIQMRTGRERQAEPQAGENAEACPAADLAAVSTWGQDDADPLSGIWTGPRPLLITEKGDIDPDLVMAHARRLIHATLGTEALAHLSLLDQRDIQIDMLRDLAHLVDANTTYIPQQLQKFSSCTDETGLWALLATDGAEVAPTEDLSHILGLFNRLPLHLQRLTGTRLVRKLNTLGHPEEAASLLAVLERRQATPPQELQALKAETDLQSDEIESGEARLGALIYDNSELSPNALLTLLNAREGRGETAPEDLLLLAEGFVHELSNDPLSEQLQAAVIRGHARAGRFEPAVASLRRYPDKRSDAYDAVRSDLANRLAELAADNTFLIQVFALDMIFDHERLDGLARHALAKRLISLGFHGEAATLLENLALPKEATRLVRAQIAIAQQRPNDALTLLQAVSTPEAEALQATARRDVGQHASSASSFAALNKAPQARITAWEANKDELIQAHGTPQEQRFVSALADIGTGVSLAEQAERASREVTFNHMMDLLSGSEGFRQAAQEVLAQQQ